MEYFAKDIGREREREREKEKEKEREKEREREREGEMEAALYTNCLLLGLDAAVLGGQAVGMQRVGLFKHSNPRVGEALLHFLLSALRGPSLSARDFAGVWPIFDAAQSRDFRKIVQTLINDLEAQGALPRSNSRVSSLATCCGQRFVELLWQLSAHALREVHKRSFPADIAVKPLPASLTEVASLNSHAAALLSITKARIAVERKRFLEGASSAVRRQALWASLANDMTAEYRSLCAEEAYLHQELEKIQDMHKVQGKVADGAKALSSGYASEQGMMSVSQASQLWESLLTHTEQHERLASGPVEDLIGHREHRYRVDGNALRTAIDRGSVSSQSYLAASEDGTTRQNNEADVLLPHGWIDGRREILDSSQNFAERAPIDESRSRPDDRPGKLTSQLDVAEILRRWTHALHRLHKQTLRLAKSNEGAGPDLLKDALRTTENGHAQALQATLTEHRQHLANMKVLIGQLKESIPGMEAAVATLREQANSLDTVHACTAAGSGRAGSFFETSTTAKVDRNGGDTFETMCSKNSHLELVPPSPALKLPQLLSTSPTTLEKVAQLQKRFNSFTQMHVLEILHEEDLRMGSATGTASNEDGSDAGDEAINSLRQTIRESTLTQPVFIPEAVSDKINTHNSEHYFTPIAINTKERNMEEKKGDAAIGKHRRHGAAAVSKVQPGSNMWKASEDVSRRTIFETANDFQGHKISRASSPPLLLDFAAFDEIYDDLLGG